MATAKEIRNEKLAATIIRQLRQRHYEACYCRNTTELLDKVISIIPEGSTITWGGSDSIRSSGLTARLKEGNYKVFDRDDAHTDDEKLAIYRKAFECDYYLASVNAISEDGVIVNIDGNGNRVGASINGPKKVVYVVGRNKIVDGGIDDAIARIKKCACPPNCRRLGKQTPCAATGVCADCDSPDRICKVTVVFDRKPTGIACDVVLIDEELGY